MKHLIKGLITSIFRKRQDIALWQNSIQFFVATKNQKDCLSPVKNKIRNSYFAGHGVSVDCQYPLWLSYLLASPFLPIVVARMIRSDGDRRKFFRFFFDHYWLIYGYYIAARYWIRKVRPVAIILSNDHDYPNRCILKVAKEQNIPIFYFQHASVTDKFPPLGFDYALLDGLDALEKYDRAGPSTTKAFLVGMGKSDDYFNHINRNDRVQSVGICVNNADEIDGVERLCKALRKAFSTLPIWLRPHPGDIVRYPEWLRLKNNYKMEFSDARNELSFEFLRKVDAVIVGESNILLEAALMNVFPIYYDINQAKLDWYGFLKSGLAEYLADPDLVCEKLRSLLDYKPVVRARAKRYCHTIGTDFDGRSTDLSSVLIKELIAKNKDTMKNWRRISGRGIEAYELSSTE